MSTTRTRVPLVLLLLLLLGACTTQQGADDPAADVGGFFDPAAVEGETITITGEVSEVLEGGAFRIAGDEFGADGITIVAPDVTGLEQGTVARITGVVTENDLEALNAELDQALSQDDLDQVDARFVVAADQVQRLIPDSDPSDVSVAEAAQDLATALQQRAGDFAALVAATVQERGGPYTLFAPEDEALAGQAGSLLSDPGRLQSVLSYHVVEGRYRTADLADLDTLTTLNGSQLTITTRGDQVLVNGLPIVQEDINVTGGVAHVIGGVLTPPS